MMWLTCSRVPTIQICALSPCGCDSSSLNSVDIISPLWWVWVESLRRRVPNHLRERGERWFKINSALPPVVAGSQVSWLAVLVTLLVSDALSLLSLIALGNQFEKHKLKVPSAQAWMSVCHEYFIFGKILVRGCIEKINRRSRDSRNHGKQFHNTTYSSNGMYPQRRIKSTCIFSIKLCWNYLQGYELAS